MYFIDDVVDNTYGRHVLLCDDKWSGRWFPLRPHSLVVVITRAYWDWRVVFGRGDIVSDLKGVPVES